jgi:ADP-ribosylglycohydrolase/catechol 2,3-dioxygenase-like lactoylglutathione lyase family enzyme
MSAELSRARGAMLAAAYGDALGWPVEERGNRVGGISRVPTTLHLVDWVRREGGAWASHEQPVRAGEYSDDTQLLLATARSLTRGRSWLDHLRRLELPLWTIYQRGGGGATKRAARAWFQGRPPWHMTNAKARSDYFLAGGNGTAMRCLPYAIAACDERELRRRVDLDGLSTHGHPRALVGARAYSWAAFWALRRDAPIRYGELLDRTLDAVEIWAAPPELDDDWLRAAREADADFARTWDMTIQEMIGFLSTARDGMAHGAMAVDAPVLNEIGVFGKAKGAGTVTAAAALFLAARYATQPEQALLASAFAKGSDTDTVASMTGGLLGCLRGEEWLLPLTSDLQDVQYIAAQVEDLVQHREAAYIDAPFTHPDRRRLYRWLDEADVGERYELEPFGEIDVTDIADLPCRSQFVRTWRLSSGLGQTILITRTGKGTSDGRARWARPLNSTGRADLRITPTPGPLRAGMVLPVFDLDEAAAFYEHTLGMDVQRRHERWVSFGWLALERDPRVTQRSMVPLIDPNEASVRLYVTADRLDELRDHMTRLGMPVIPLEHVGNGAFRSADLDGHPLEFCVLNGAPPPLSKHGAT